MRPKLLLLLVLAVSVMPQLQAEPSSPVPCRFPEKCGCSLEHGGKFLRCNSMENCLSQQGMNDLASGVRWDTCPVTQLYITCSIQKVKLIPTINMTSDLFRHRNWARLELLMLGSGCLFVFSETQVLSQLPNLTSLRMVSAKLWTDLSQFSDIFCTSKKLQTILLQEVTAEKQGRLLGRESFIKCNALGTLRIINSKRILTDQVDFLMNTSSNTFKLHFKSCLPIGSKSFSNISLINLVNGSSLSLLITNAKEFALDAPANIAGFQLKKLSISQVPMKSIGDSSFQGLSLTDVTLTGVSLNGTLIRKLLTALTKSQTPSLAALSIEFNLDSKAFPFDEFNAACQTTPNLRQLSISHSPISLVSSAGKFLNCPQIRILSLTNCELRNPDLPNDVFKFMPNLKNLNLDGNRLDLFPTEIFRSTRYIQRLSISGNSFMELKASSLHGILPTLTHLTASHSGIREPLTDAFIHQPNLTSLTLNSLRTLKQIDCPFKNTWFRNCSKLKMLSLSGCTMLGTKRCEAKGFFEPLTNLEELDLTSSDIGSQQTASLKQLLTNLTSLKSLQMAGNKIKLLEYILTSPLPKLENLHLGTNSLSGIPRDLLVTMTPNLQRLFLMTNTIVFLEPVTFDRLPKLRIKIGPSQFACNCELLPFTNWMRSQLPIYQVETRETWLSNAICYTLPDGSYANRTVIRLLHFNMSWWDCYSRRLIVALSTSIAVLACTFSIISLLVKYRWKLQYEILTFCIRHGLVKRRVQREWEFDGCFIYDETDPQVSQWVTDLILKLETDLQLRLYEPERDAPAGANILDEAASAIDKSRHAVLVVTRGFLENRLNMYSAQWSNESLFMRRRSLAVIVMRERLTESQLKVPGCKVLHRLYRMCKPDRIVDCSGCGVGGNSANRLGLMLYRGAGVKGETRSESDGAAETAPLLGMN